MMISIRLKGHKKNKLGQVEILEILERSMVYRVNQPPHMGEWFG